MMQPGVVSVMMPAYNAEKYIAEAIQSVLAQTYPHWELLVVNDGSTDRTAEIAAQFTDLRIRLLDKENGGESSARNMALDHSQGEFIAYLDADDAWLPHHLQVTMSYLLARPDRDAVYTDGYHYDEDSNRGQPLSSRRRGPFTGRIFEEVVRASDVFGPPICVVLRHDLAAEHHLRYDTRIVIGPDWDFFVRYADLAQFGYVADHTCLYRVHQTNITLQVDQQKRAGYLALCREKAIQMANFQACSLATKTAVFYDLLINLLANQPERQTAVTQWPQFTALPLMEQAHLFRLLASKAILGSGSEAYIYDWLHQARTLAPTNRLTALLGALYNISPTLSRQLLRARSWLQPESPPTPPFGNLR